MKAPNGNPLRDKEIGNPGAHESGGSGHKGKRGERGGIHGTMISWEKETVKTGTPCRNSEKAPADRKLPRRLTAPGGHGRMA